MVKPTGYGGRDYPDFGVSSTAGGSAQITDLSELAVRLGGLNWFDRLGNVLVQEGFERGITNWEQTYWPEGANPVSSARYYSTVPYSANLVTTTQNGSYSGITRSFPFPYLASFGVELHFKTIVPFKYLHWHLHFYDGTWKHYVGVRVNYANSQIELINVEGDFEKVADLDIKIGANSPFHIIKATIDLDSDCYVRLMLDANDYNVRDIGILKEADNTSPYLYMIVFLTAVASTANQVWVDNIIFTINEPL